MAVGGSDEATISGVLEAVEAREEQVSTALGGGLAVPHGRTDLVSELRLAAGIVHDVPDYIALDDTEVRVVFLVLTPLSASGLHVKLLARIARLMHKPESRDALIATRSAADFLSVIRTSEAA